MQVSVKGKQMDVGDALRGHVTQSLEGIVGKYFGRAMEAHAVFAREAHLFRCDLSVHIGRDILVQSEGDAADAYGAFDVAADRVGKRLRRHKRWLRDHHARARDGEAGVAARTYVLSPEGEGEGEDEAADRVAAEPVIVAEMATEIPTVSVGEAVTRMDLADLPSFIFRNVKNGVLNVVYRRKDGNIGWVDPDLALSSRQKP